MKKIVLYSFFILLLIACSDKNKKSTSSITDDQIKQSEENNSNNKQELTDISGKISIKLSDGFILNENLENDNFIMFSAYNGINDVSLSVFDLGRVDKEKYLENLTEALKKQPNTEILSKNDKSSLIFKANYPNDINEVCNSVIANDNNLFLVCVNSDTLPLEELQKEIESIRIN